MRIHKIRFTCVPDASLKGERPRFRVKKIGKGHWRVEINPDDDKSKSRSKGRNKG